MPHTTKLLTKEEILTENELDLYSDGNDLGCDVKDYISRVHNSMDIWAKQQSIAFAEWNYENKWDYYKWGKKMKNNVHGWNKIDDLDAAPLTTEQLYNLLLTQSQQ